MPPQLFDLDLLARRRARAAAAPGGPADFLHAVAADEIADRLAEVNRSFRSPAVISPRGDVWADRLRAAGAPAARVVPDAETLDLAPGAHDLVVHGLALHWANDPVGQLVQSRRALAPDGLFLGALFGAGSLAELRAALGEAEVAETGGLSPRVAPMGEIRDLGSLLQRAGFAMPVADSLRADARYPDALALMRDLRAMGETNVMRSRLARPTPARVFARAAAIYRERFGAPDGRVRASFEIVVLTGWAPGAGQPKPLRPGSAAARLADALGVAERGLGESADPGRRDD
ncbi:methyltransferase domain-containing protein [Amaricoccus sp.]|uniref:methyltransferase domain-containing protein n=1 Tax=Amaricoccus sp. TaxID=1872485 RepID=UPI001B77CD66|nr:methyltransferase domain-containing protein [Amaricoccus sp.]MBP7241311.1 methyltransferase domain-containing protein [Amaricoccus sp.]